MNIEFKSLANFTKRLFLLISKQEDVNVKFDLYTNIKKMVNKQELELLEQIKDGYIFCTNCELYYKKQDYDYIEKLETFTQTVYSDCGYGDDDRIAEVTYLIKYSICKKCGQKKIINRTYIKAENERNVR